MNNWRCCRLQFNNDTFTVGTDGHTIRIRAFGLKPQEAVLVDCEDAQNVQTIRMNRDAVLTCPEKCMKPWKEIIDDGHALNLD